MGLLDSLFGTSKARKDIQATSVQAQAQLDAARQRAEGALTGREAQGRLDLGAGFDTATGLYDRLAPSILAGLQGGYGLGADALRSGYGGAEAAITDAANRARSDYVGQYGGAEDAINAGVAGARGDYATGYGAAGDELRRGLATARNDYATGYGGAESAVNAGLSAANAALSPYQSSGVRAQGQFDASMGGDLSGYGTFRGSLDPFTSYADSLADKNQAAAMNARGISGGRALTAQSRAVAEREEGRVRDYLDRLERAAGRGQQVAGQVSANNMSAGQSVAGLRTGMADRMGSTEMAGRGAIAGTQTGLADRAAGATLTGAQAVGNVRQGLGDRLATSGMTTGGQIADTRAKLGVGLADNAVSGATAGAQTGLNLLRDQSTLATGRGQSLAGAGANTGSQLSNLIYGAGQQGAANTINTGNAIAQTRTQPMSNLINLLGTGVQGLTLYNNWGIPRR